VAFKHRDGNSKSNGDSWVPACAGMTNSWKFDDARNASIASVLLWNVAQHRDDASPPGDFLLLPYF